MRQFTSRAAATAALIGGCVVVAGGCGSKVNFPASPVPAPLSDFQAIELAEDHLDTRADATRRRVHSVEPTGDGHFVAFHSAFDDAGKPPVHSRLLEVKHDGSVRELVFRRSK